MKNKNKNKKLSIILGLAVITAALGLTAALSGMKKPPEKKATTYQPPAVPTITVKLKNIQSRIPVIGYLTAKNKIEIFTEVNGILMNSKKPLLEGIHFKKGEPLLKLNSKELEQSLKAQKSALMTLISHALPDLKFDYPKAYDNYRNFLKEFTLDKKMPTLPVPISEQEKYFLAGNSIYTTYYDITAMEEKLKKYTLYAPFTGVVANSSIKPGTLVRTGQLLGEFICTDSFDLETHIDLENIPLIQKGNVVELQSDAMPGKWIGKVTRISNRIDNSTQTLKIYVTVSGSNLKENMYLKGDILGQSFLDAIELPRRLLKTNNRIMIVKNNTIELIPIKILQLHPETLIAQDIPHNTRLPLKTDGLHEGLKVRVTDAKTI